jgi:hypothetical protein
VRSSRLAVVQALIEHSEAMQAAERQSISVRQLKQAEEAQRSMTEQLAVSVYEYHKYLIDSDSVIHTAG